MPVAIEVECIGCKKRWDIDYVESQRLSLQGEVPMCSDCGSPAVCTYARSAGATRKR
jgi:NAD-dependent SIR2 family protein deacetylase